MSSIVVPNLLDQFKESLIKEVPDIIEFAESPKYLGKKLYPRQRTLLKIIFLQDLDDYDLSVIAEWESEDSEVELSPKLLERMAYLKGEGYQHFRLVQLVGGRRSGKGFMTAICIAYKLYLLTLMESVGKHYGIEEGKAIFFSIIADSMEQAKTIQFADATNALVDLKPFQEKGLISKIVAESIHINTPFDLRRLDTLKRAGATLDRDMASLIVKAFSTNSKTLRGSASMMFVLDEFAHFITGESKMSDEQIWQAATPSLMQFGKDAMIFANSSPYSKTGKFFDLYNQALQLDPPKTGKPVFPEHFMIRYPSWETYKDWERDPEISGTIVGDPKTDPIVRQEEIADPVSFKVEYRSNFAEVEDAFLSPEMVDRVFDPGYTKEILGYELVPQHGGHFGVMYSGHGDPATVKANFGLAVGHKVEVINQENGNVEQHVVFDFINAFFPEDFDEHTIDWLEVIPSITELINNFRPTQFTFDQFESTATIQMLQENLRRMNVSETNIYSIFATAKVNEQRAKTFRTAINLGRVHAPHPNTYMPLGGLIGLNKNPIDLVRTELKYLVEKNGRVDKQTVGPVQTKDIADCMMEVVNALIGDSISAAYGNLSQQPLAWGQGLGANTSSFTDLSDFYGDIRRGDSPRYGSRARGHRGR